MKTEDMTEKKTKGRKRHIVTDTMGNLLCVHVHADNIHDTRAEYILLKKLYIVIPHLLAFVPIKDTGVLLKTRLKFFTI
jgi:hypothetical protein